MFWRSVISILLALLTIVPAGAQAQDYAIRPQFEYAGHFHDGIAPVLQNGRWGFIDITGNWVVQPRFDAVKAGADRRFGVQQRGLWGYINSAGQRITRMRFKTASRFSDGMAVVSDDGTNYYVIDKSGKDTNKGTRFRKISLMRDGHAAVLTAYDNWTVLVRGRPAPEITYNEASELTPFSEGNAFMLEDGSYKVVQFNEYNVTSALLVLRERSFKLVRPFRNGLAAVSRDGERWGFIGQDGQFVIQPQFEGAREFAEGVAPVKFNGRWGYVNRAGAFVFPPSFDRAYSFREGYATTRNGDLRGFLKMDRNGRITSAYPPQFEDVYGFREGLAPVKANGVWGFIKAEGVNVRLLPPIREETALRTLRP